MEPFLGKSALTFAVSVGRGRPKKVVAVFIAGVILVPGFNYQARRTSIGFIMDDVYGESPLRLSSPHVDFLPESPFELRISLTLFIPYCATFIYIFIFYVFPDPIRNAFTADTSRTGSGFKDYKIRGGRRDLHVDDFPWPRLIHAPLDGPRLL